MPVDAELASDLCFRESFLDIFYTGGEATAFMGCERYDCLAVEVDVFK